MTFTNTVEVANKLVEVALVNIAVEAPVAPIGVLLIEPPSIVRPFTTIASVMEFDGSEREPETYKLVVLALVEILFTTTLLVAKRFVEVMETASKLVGLKLDAVIFVALREVKKPLVEVIDVASTMVDVMAVPDAEVKARGPVNVPPAKGK